MTTKSPLELYANTVPADWIDYNGHMNVAYYVLAFDQATDEFFDYLGIGNSYVEQHPRCPQVLEHDRRY